MNPFAPHPGVIDQLGSAMNFVAFLAVGFGAFAGAVLRWLFGVLLNPILPTLPLGTLAANLVGALIMGLTMGVFVHFEALPIAWRLAITTGFLGGLTTFSTFSAETVTLFLRQQYGWTAAIITAHLLGSLLMTLAGIALVRVLLRT
jgi:CrcB protein